MTHGNEDTSKKHCGILQNSPDLSSEVFPQAERHVSEMINTAEVFIFPSESRVHGLFLLYE